MAGERADDVVRLDLVAGESGNTDGLNKLFAVTELVFQIVGSGRAVGFVVGVYRVAAGAGQAFVKCACQQLWPAAGDQLVEKFNKAVYRVGRAAIGIDDGTWQRMPASKYIDA